MQLDYSGPLPVIARKSFHAMYRKDGPVHPHDPSLGICWIWVGSQFKGSGRARFSWRHRGSSFGTNASRIAYAEAHGSFDSELFVCHSCDNKLCVNPAHLWLGTHQDNMDDMKGKGRTARLFGEHNGARIHRDKIVRGENHWARKHPELIPKGEARWNAKLTQEKADTIRELHGAGDSTRSISAKFSVSRSLVDRIVRRERWT